MMLLARVSSCVPSFQAVLVLYSIVITLLGESEDSGLTLKSLEAMHLKRDNCGLEMLFGEVNRRFNRQTLRFMSTLMGTSIVGVLLRCVS